MTEDPEVSGGSLESVASLKLGDKVQTAKVKYSPHAALSTKIMQGKHIKSM